YLGTPVEAANRFHVLGGSEPVCPKVVEGDAVISTDSLSQLIAALYETAIDPQEWKFFLELLRSHAAGNFASLVVRDPNGENLGWVISATGSRAEVMPYDPYAQWSPFVGIAK